MVNISKEARNPLIAVLYRGDNETMRIRFAIPRRADGVDLGGLAWRIKIVNAAGATDSFVPTERAPDDDAVLIDWRPGAAVATAAVGMTQVQLEAVGDADSPPVWQSAVYLLDIRERLEAEPTTAEVEPLTQLQQLIVQVSGELTEIREAGRLAKEAYQHPPVIDDDGSWLVWDWETESYVDTGKPSQGEGGGGGNVASVNGKTGAVVLTAKDVGALAEDRLPEAVDDALAQAKASGEFDGPQGPKGDAGDTGPQGPKGETGANGVSPIVFIMDIDGGHRVTIADEYATKNFDVMDGKDGVDGSTPVKGVDYYTDADRADIVAEVIAALPVYNGEVADA